MYDMLRRNHSMYVLANKYRNSEKDGPTADVRLFMMEPPKAHPRELPHARLTAGRFLLVTGLTEQGMSTLFTSAGPICPL